MMLLVPAGVAQATVVESITGYGVGAWPTYADVTYATQRVHAASSNDGKISLTGTYISDCHGGSLWTGIVWVTSGNQVSYDSELGIGVLRKYKKLSNDSYDWQKLTFVMRAGGSPSGCDGGATWSGTLRY
ncbi:MAG: hypothetical protein QM635_02845 [Microbacteriaceae bacterium]